MQLYRLNVLVLYRVPYRRCFGVVGIYELYMAYTDTQYSLCWTRSSYFTILDADINVFIITTS